MRTLAPQLAKSITVLLMGILLSFLWAFSASAEAPDDPGAAALPVPGFDTDARALVIVVLSIDSSTMQYIDAFLSDTPPGATFASPSQLGVTALDAQGGARFSRSSPYPNWVLDQDDNGNEVLTYLDGQVAYINMPFDPEVREVRIRDLRDQSPLMAADLTPALVRFCTEGDIIDQEYCEQFPCYNDPSLPGCQDTFDACPTDPFKSAPGICGCGIPDNDTDLDGSVDCQDSCPADPLKLEPGACDCGEPDSDADGDGVEDCIDQCPSDPSKDAPGACGCGTADTDSDGDGIEDCLDFCPLDLGKAEPGMCGCGIADDDADGDGVPDCKDNCPDTPNAGQQDGNGDGTGDACTAPAPNAGNIDINRDGKVNYVDLWLMIVALGKCSGDSGYEPRADFTGDACVTKADFNEWLVEVVRAIWRR